DFVAREVGDLDGVDQTEIRPLAGRYRHLELCVEVGPEDALLLDLDARLVRELVDQPVHHLAVGAGESVPVGDRRLRLGPRPPRHGRHRGRCAKRTPEEPATAEGGAFLAPGVVHDVLLCRARRDEGMARVNLAARVTSLGLYAVRLGASTPWRAERPIAA